MILDTLGPMVSPLPSIGGIPIPTAIYMDDLKVHGNANTKNGKILDGNYDFIDPKTGTLEQPISSIDPLWRQGLTHARNQLNKVAFSQHSPNGKPFHIEYMYSDNDLIYGRDNFAPWKPDVDSEYARPYGWYLDYQASKNK